MAEGTPATRVLFYVQHLLGVGHLKRAATICRALSERSFDVTLVSGGQSVPGLDIGGATLHQLPALRAVDKYFKVLVDDHGRELDDDMRAVRRDALLSLYDNLRPEIVITELFPFGRRQLRHELLPLLQRANDEASKPLVVSSVRDILVEPPKPERVREMLERIEALYDLVLVHGDPELISFDQTFPLAHEIADRLRYTGYVVDTRPDDGGADGPGEVIVSAGGGAVSEELFRAALEARPLTPLKDRIWRLLAGSALDDGVFGALQSIAPEGVIVERARPDFPMLLRRAALSVSQGGYNTVMEVMTAGIRGVIVPYAGGLETEQTLRAALLEKSAGLHPLDEGGLTGETLAATIARALDGPPASAAAVDVSGAETTADILAERIAARRALQT